MQVSQNQPAPAADRHLIAFEQPLNERMRMFLRVEFLHRQALLHASHETEYGARAAVSSLLEILAITSRGDIRADAIKELDRHLLRLNQFQRRPGVDAERLAGLVSTIDEIRGKLSAAGKNFLSGLRESEFLNAIRHRSAIPGGTCMFDMPDYGYWLKLPHSERSSQLSAWLGELKPVCDAIDQALWLSREAATPTEVVAAGGLYNQNLGKEDHFDLVRVLVPRTSGLFPEISAGQHRFTVRFAEWQGTDHRPRQASSDVTFLLAMC
jgi:cell division protein ZapD